MPQNTLQYPLLNSVFSEHFAQTMVFISNEKGSPIGLPFFVRLLSACLRRDGIGLIEERSARKIVDILRPQIELQLLNLRLRHREILIRDKAEQ